MKANKSILVLMLLTGVCITPAIAQEANGESVPVDISQNVPTQAETETAKAVEQDAKRSARREAGIREMQRFSVKAEEGSVVKAEPVAQAMGELAPVENRQNAPVRTIAETGKSVAQGKGLTLSEHIRQAGPEKSGLPQAANAITVEETAAAKAGLVAQDVGVGKTLKLSEHIGRLEPEKGGLPQAGNEINAEEMTAAKAGPITQESQVGKELKLSEHIGQMVPEKSGQPQVANEIKTEETAEIKAGPVVGGKGELAPVGNGQNTKVQAEEQSAGKAKKAAEMVTVKAMRAAEIKAARLKARDTNVLLDAVRKAVLKNPDVLTRWDNFLVAVKETDVARGHYFPRVDLSVSRGRESYGTDATPPTAMTRRGTTLTLSQMLYDGFATRNEVRRLTSMQLARYYDLLDASETAALDALRAYYDVVRNRKLFELTEDNYVTHRKAYEHILQKVQAGVGRRVDLEQASGRVSLSKSNLTLDNANIHDASARYQRAVGELPPPEMTSPESQATQGEIDKLILPNAAAATLAVAIDSHPAILSAVANVRAAKYDMYQRWAGYQPTVNLQVSQTHNINYAGITGLTKDTVAEVVMTWNLFNGGADRARSGQYAKRLEAARDQRDKTCRDIRMNLAIAYNDIAKLKEQLNFMNEHQIAIAKAANAYQKQFEIGQRSLIDVLDSENELYQAQRSYVNAQYDLYIAQARTVAGMGKLVSSLGLSRLETPDLPEMLGTNSDGPANCMADPPLANTYNIDDLNARADREMEEARPKLRAGMDASGGDLTGDSMADIDAQAAALDAAADKAAAIDAADTKAAADADLFMQKQNEAKAAKAKAAGARETPFK